MPELHGKLSCEQQSALFHAEHMGLGIIVVEVPFNIEKSKSCFAIADDQLKRFIPVHSLNNELVEGGSQCRRKECGVLRHKSHGPELGTAQLTIENKNREERIRRHRETQRVHLRPGAGSVQPVQIDVHRDPATRHNHLLKRARLTVLAGCFEARYGTVRMVAGKQNGQRTDQECLQHSLSLYFIVSTKVTNEEQ